MNNSGSCGADRGTGPWSTSSRGGLRPHEVRRVVGLDSRGSGHDLKTAMTPNISKLYHLTTSCVVPFDEAWLTNSRQVRQIQGNLLVGGDDF